METGIGRALNLAITSLPGFTLPGDTSASKPLLPGRHCGPTGDPACRWHHPTVRRPWSGLRGSDRSDRPLHPAPLGNPVT